MIVLKNCMEEIVINRLDSFLKSAGVCDCETCKLDIAALVLNKINPKYVVTTKGAVLTKVDYTILQKDIDMIRLFMDAIEIVKESPHHHRDEPKY